MGMEQMKQALINAGVVSKEKLRLDVEKEKVRKRHTKDDPKMHKDQIRIVCDVCGKSAPDVEQYKHNHRLIAGKEWLCLMCADEHCIDDTCRISDQSSQAKQKMFRRQYGRTKRF